MENIITLINNATRIAIMPHVSADGDALGSSLALAMALRKINKDCVIYLEEEVPLNYKFLPCLELVETFCEPCEYDLVLALDTGDIQRLGNRYKVFEMATNTVNIDHHTTNTNFAQVNHVDVKSSATGEIIYDLIKTMCIDFDKDIATCLYVAIATDTGGFRYSNTTPLTHSISSELIDHGVDVSSVSQMIFETNSLSKVMLMGAAINTLEILEEGKVAFMAIADSMLKETGALEEDCEGIVNIGRNIRGVEVALLIRERFEGEYKINFRSKNYVDVSMIASKYKGGGHQRASGCTINGQMCEIKNSLLQDIRELL